MNDIFDGLEIDQAEYELPNGKKLTLVALDIFQRIEVQKKIRELSDDDDYSKFELFKEVAGMSILDENFEPYLTKKQLNMLSRINSGQVLFDVFNTIMDLSGASSGEAKKAKKK